MTLLNELSAWYHCELEDVGLGVQYQQTVVYICADIGLREGNVERQEGVCLWCYVYGANASISSLPHRYTIPNNMQGLNQYLASLIEGRRLHLLLDSSNFSQAMHACFDVPPKT